MLLNEWGCGERGYSLERGWSRTETVHYWGGFGNGHVGSSSKNKMTNADEIISMCGTGGMAHHEDSEPHYPPQNNLLSLKWVAGLVTYRNNHVIIKTPGQRPPHGPSLTELCVRHLRHLSKKNVETDSEMTSTLTTAPSCEQLHKGECLLRLMDNWSLPSTGMISEFLAVSLFWRRSAVSRVWYINTM